MTNNESLLSFSADSQSVKAYEADIDKIDNVVREILKRLTDNL
jgi:hypothetical protein